MERVIEWIQVVGNRFQSVTIRRMQLVKIKIYKKKSHQTCEEPRTLNIGLRRINFKTICVQNVLPNYNALNCLPVRSELCAKWLLLYCSSSRFNHSTNNNHDDTYKRDSLDIKLYMEL